MKQELNASTASFTVRVNDAFSYYNTFLVSFDTTIPKIHRKGDPPVQEDSQ